MKRRDLLKAAVCGAALAAAGNTLAAQPAQASEIFLIGGLRCGKTVMAVRLMKEKMLDAQSPAPIALCVGYDGVHIKWIMQRITTMDTLKGERGPLFSCCFSVQDWSGKIRTGKPNRKRITIASCLEGTLFFHGSRERCLWSEEGKYDVIWCDERIYDPDLWGHLVDKRLKPGGTAIYSSWPEPHVKRIIDSRPSATVLHIPTFSNPYLSRKAVSEFVASVRPEDYAQRVLGQF